MARSFKTSTRRTKMFYGQFELDRVLYETFFKDKKGGFFVECGAFDGLTECSCKFFEESMGWTGVNIEPTPYAYSRLVINRPNTLNINKALSAKAETKTFTNAIHPGLGHHFGNGSLAHTPEHKRELVDMGCSFETFNVDCVPFTDIHQENNLGEIDLFVLDVEGHEIEALKGIVTLEDKYLPKVFCIEHSISGAGMLENMLASKYDLHSKHAHNAFFVRK